MAASEDPQLIGPAINPENPLTKELIQRDQQIAIENQVRLVDLKITQEAIQEEEKKQTSESLAQLQTESAAKEDEIRRSNAELIKQEEAKAIESIRASSEQTGKKLEEKIDEIVIDPKQQLNSDWMKYQENYSAAFKEALQGKDLVDRNGNVIDVDKLVQAVFEKEPKPTDLLRIAPHLTQNVTDVSERAVNMSIHSDFVKELKAHQFIHGESVKPSDIAKNQKNRSIVHDAIAMGKKATGNEGSKLFERALLLENPELAATKTQQQQPYRTAEHKTAATPGVIGSEPRDLPLMDKMTEYYYNKLADLTEGKSVDQKAVSDAAAALREQVKIAPDKASVKDRLSAIEAAEQITVAQLNKSLGIVAPIPPAQPSYDSDANTKYAVKITASNSEQIIRNALDKINAEDKSANKLQMTTSANEIHISRQGGEYFVYSKMTGEFTTNATSQGAFEDMLKVFKESHPGQQLDIAVDSHSMETVKQACESKGVGLKATDVSIVDIKQVAQTEEKRKEVQEPSVAATPTTPEPMEAQRTLGRG